MRAQKKFSETMGISGGLNGENGGLRGQILTSLNTRHRQPRHFGGKEGGCEPPAMPFCPTAALPRKRRERGACPAQSGAPHSPAPIFYIYGENPPFITLTILQSEVAKVLKIYATDERRKNILTTREKMFRIFVSGKQCASRVCHGRSFPQSGQALPQQPSATRRLNPLQPKYKPF